MQNKYRLEIWFQTYRDLPRPQSFSTEKELEMLEKQKDLIINNVLREIAEGVYKE